MIVFVTSSSLEIDQNEPDIAVGLSSIAIPHGMDSSFDEKIVLYCIGSGAYCLENASQTNKDGCGRDCERCRCGRIHSWTLEIKFVHQDSLRFQDCVMIAGSRLLRFEQTLDSSLLSFKTPRALESQSFTSVQQDSRTTISICFAASPRSTMNKTKLPVEDTDTLVMDFVL